MCITYMVHGCRETKVFLHCDPSANTPMATTDGDTAEILHYVYNKIHYVANNHRFCDEL